MNSAKITGPRDKISQLAIDIRKQNDIEDGGVCNAIIPCPQELLDRKKESDRLLPEWYVWRTNNWGTKWDFMPIDEPGYDLIDDDTAVFEMSFDTAWSPPLALYDKLVEQGFEVTADYFEPGMCFVGAYDNGNDETYDWGDEDSSTVEDAVPEFLVDKYGLKEMLEEMEAEEGEEYED
ncbi:MAG: hypothetical protein LC687_03920 [Actinobacteria bacterium]|nr:hypothetical protein [Actinomycetota bacterium]MCA1806987.1 hypothetical protein [Actinomycetota bacterium]